MLSNQGIGAITLLSLVFACMSLLPHRLAGVTVESQGNEVKAPSKSDGVILISAESEALEMGKPFRLKVTITNRSDSPLSLNSYPDLRLLKGDHDPQTPKPEWDSFTSTVCFEPDADYMKKDFLTPGESISFDTDITTLKWGRSSSAFLPSSNIFEAVPKGDYTLWVQLVTGKTEQGGESHVYSNTIKVVIK